MGKTSMDFSRLLVTTHYSTHEFFYYLLCTLSTTGDRIRNRIRKKTVLWLKIFLIFSVVVVYIHQEKTSLYTLTDWVTKSLFE